MTYIRSACFGIGLILIASAGNLTTAIAGGVLLSAGIFLPN